MTLPLAILNPPIAYLLHQHKDDTMQTLTISGSLREHSFNSAILRYICSLSDDTVHFECYDALSTLPPFNPDLEERLAAKHPSLTSVLAFMEAIKRADALLFSTPEYAFAIPGVLKNALDWLVSSEVIVNKPVAIISASTSNMGANSAHEALTHLLGVISGNIIAGTSLQVVRVNKKIDSNGVITDETLRLELEDITKLIRQAVNNS